MTARALLAGMRPSHAWKNVPVVAGLVFGRRLHDPAAVVATAVCLLAFVVVAGGGYLVNDVLDREADRTHPRRRRRPVASGAVSPRAAAAAGGAAVVAGTAAAALWTPPTAALLVAVYAATTLVYSAAGKRVPGVGPVLVAAGFVLRVAAGAAAAGVAPSPWLLPLTGVLALALATAKREAEARRAAGQAPRALRRWTDALLGASAAGYLAWTLAPGTVALHGTRALVWTSGPVVGALLRFRRRLRADATGLGPAELVARDPVLLGWGALWLATSIVVLERSG